MVRGRTALLHTAGSVPLCDGLLCVNYSHPKWILYIVLPIVLRGNTSFHTAGIASIIVPIDARQIKAHCPIVYMSPH